MKPRSNRGSASLNESNRVYGDSLKSARSLLDQGHLQEAALSLLKTIERMLRTTMKSSLSDLGDAERLRVQKIESEIGLEKKGIDKFTFGQLVGLARRSGFFSMIESHRATRLTRARAIDWDELAQQRNALSHEDTEVTRQDVEWLLETTISLGEEFQLIDPSTTYAEPRGWPIDSLPFLTLLVVVGCAYTLFEVFKTLYFDGEPLPEVVSRLPALEANLPDLRISKIDPASATLSRPYKNVIGMTFVPLDGLRILVARHETTVSNFRRFQIARDLPVATGTSWENPGFPQSENHPVVEVSWNDANAFCLWLTEQEGHTYRLPTDAEWSVAAGIGAEETEADMPGEKNRRHPEFPWKSEVYPPPPKFANFGIPGADDGFEFTSPVGSFLPNQNGLFDLAGNVWEWCADAYSEKDPYIKVLRGNSWENYSGPSLVTSARDAAPPDTRSRNYGFRVVLELP